MLDGWVSGWMERKKKGFLQWKSQVWIIYFGGNDGDRNNHAVIIILKIEPGNNLH